MDKQSDVRIEAARREFKRLRAQSNNLSWNERFDIACESHGLNDAERDELLRRLG